MPGWQQFYEAHREGFEILSIAMDQAGADAARPFVRQAGATFPTIVDGEAVTARLMDFKVVPNGVMVDSEGVIRYAKYGGFSVNNAEDGAAVERFIAGGDPGPGPATDLPYRLKTTEQDLVRTKLRLGNLLSSVGRQEEAVVEWKDALHLDPENFVIRKQIWAALYPEKFHPTIDFSWQDGQLKRERQEEIEAGVCGPDGCPLPRR